MTLIRIDSCATEAIARRRAGYWAEAGYEVEVYPDCTVISAEGTDAGGAAGNAPVFEDAPYVVLARKPAEADDSLLE